MKAINKSLEPVLKAAIETSLKNYELQSAGNFLGDLYLYYDWDNQTLSFFDDVEKELFTINLNDEDIVEDTDNFQQEVRNTAKQVLKELEKENAFNSEFICKPFAVSMIDNDFIIMEELIFVDDNTLKLDGNLWTGLDNELDEFLKNLMQ
jgi:hypothetical protein